MVGIGRYVALELIRLTRNAIEYANIQLTNVAIRLARSGLPSSRATRRLMCCVVGSLRKFEGMGFKVQTSET